MTKFPILHYNTKNTKSKLVPPPMPPSKYEDVVGWPMIEASYVKASEVTGSFPVRPYAMTFSLR